MTTPVNADPIAIYLVDGGPVGPVPGVLDFSLTVENPEVNEEREDARRVNPRRAQQLRRRRRANPGDISLTLDYDPLEPAHQELLDAGESEAWITLRIIVYDGAGQAISAQDVDCSVLRYTLSCRQSLRRRRTMEEGRNYRCEADLRLQRQSEFRHLAVLATEEEVDMYRNSPSTRMPCPSCQQPVGRFCVTEAGQMAHTAHTPRRRLMEEINTPEDAIVVAPPA